MSATYYDSSSIVIIVRDGIIYAETECDNTILTPQGCRTLAIALLKAAEETPP